MKVLGLLSICTMTLLCLIYERVFFNFTFLSHDALRRNPNQFLSLVIIIRSCLLAYDTLISQPGNSKDYAIMSLGSIFLGCLMVYDSLVNEIFSDNSVSITYGAFSAAYLWLNLVMLLSSSLSLRLL